MEATVKQIEIEQKIKFYYIRFDETGNDELLLIVEELKEQLNFFKDCFKFLNNHIQ